MPRNNKRNKDRWHLEPEDGLRDSVEQALNEKKKQEPKLSRNEFLSRLIRRALSDEAKAPVVLFNCADPLAMAEFRGDVDKMEAYFVRVRGAILHRNRSVDRNNPEAVKKFKEDDQQTREFLKACKDLLRIAEDRAWELRGFSAGEVIAARKFLDGELKMRLGWGEERVAELRKELDPFRKSSLPLIDEEKIQRKLSHTVEKVRVYQCMIRLLNFVSILESPVTIGQVDKQSAANKPADQMSKGNLRQEDEFYNE